MDRTTSQIKIKCRIKCSGRERMFSSIYGTRLNQWQENHRSQLYHGGNPNIPSICSWLHSKISL